MKAIVKTSQEAGVFEVKEVPTPKLGRGEVMVQVKAASLRTSSLILPVFHWMNNTQRGRRSQMIRRIPKKITIATPTPNGSSLKICSIYHSIPISDLH